MKNIHYDLSSLDLGIHKAIDLLAQERPLCRLMSLRSATTAWGWWRGSVVERRSLAGELSLSCARPAADH